MPDNVITQQLGVPTEVYICQSAEELQQIESETKELLLKAGWTKKAVDQLIKQVSADKEIVLANIDRYIAEAEAKGDIAKAVGKAMKKAGKAALNINKGATQTVQSVSVYQQRSSEIAARLHGRSNNQSALGGAVNQPRLKAWWFRC